MRSASREHKNVSDREIDLAADDLLGLLREYNPKDAGSILGMAHYKMITAAFHPADKTKAIDAVRSHADLLVELLNEGWR
jgi:hypothetical protein